MGSCGDPSQLNDFDKLIFNNYRRCVEGIYWQVFIVKGFWGRCYLLLVACCCWWVLVGGAFIEEEDDGFDAGALEGAAGAVEDGVEVGGFEEHLAKGYRGIVGVAQERVLDDDGF